MKPRLREFTLLTLLAILLSTSSGGGSYAKTPKPTLAQIEAAKKAEALKRSNANAANGKLLEAKKTLNQLGAIVEETHREYVKAKTQLAKTAKRAVLVTKYANDASAVVTATHREIGKLAVNAFIDGGGFTDFEAVLSSNGPQDLVDRLSTLENLGKGNSQALLRFKSAETAAKAAQRVADAAKRDQEVATVQVALTKRVAEAARAQQQDEVDKLQAVQDQLLKELESAKRVRVTLEQRRQLALLEEARAKKASTTAGQSKIWKSGGVAGRSTFRTSESQRLKAVEFAKNQVLAGKPYVWGAEGPNSFDCSGLVYAAYRYAGLGWPNWDRLNASLYYSYTKHVAISDLQPGDLLFYSYDGKVNSIHHMSIYAGNGMVWEARSTRSGLRYSNMYSVDGMMPFGGRV
ncbi:MAG TPA: NlpC/P60 family protein [Candidatus Paceibacterota bacterium]|nr:NlpC/P60 family protein [Candidatus Paceibacterota bacterium]